MKQIRIDHFIFFIVNIISAHNEFLYPLETIIEEGIEKMCVIHQKGSSLELSIWNPENNHSHKALLSSFTPAGVKVLPNKKSFSFIFNDKIRIKNLEKRSPRTLDFYGPYDITTIEWIDDQSCYFSARERDHVNLFHATIEGDLYRLTESTTCNYLYPQKINESLFFIAHSKDGYSLMRTEYPTEKINTQFCTDRCKDNCNLEHLLKNETEDQIIFLNENSLETLLAKNDQALAFLTMTSHTSGFCVGYSELIERSQDTMTFSYYRIKDQPEWSLEELFTFTLPLELIVHKKGHTRLYESIIPLLPYYDKHTSSLYFVSLENNGLGLNVYRYCLENDQTILVLSSENPHKHYFTPRRFGNQLLCGGTIIADTDNLPTIHLSSQGQEFIFAGLKSIS